MSRQIYPTLLVTSLVLAVVVYFHPSIPEEILASAGLPLPGETRNRARADEPEYTAFPPNASTGYGVVPRAPSEPASGVRPVGWPAPANIETYGGSTIPAVQPAPQSSQVSNPLPPTYKHPSTASATVPLAQGPYPHAHVPAERHWERSLSTRGNPYRQWESPSTENAAMHKSWGREQVDAPPPYQQWNPPADVPTNASSRGLPDTASAASTALETFPRHTEHAPVLPSASGVPGSGAPPVMPDPRPPSHGVPEDAVSTAPYSPYPRQEGGGEPIPSDPDQDAEPFERAEILARVGSEVILRSELIAMVNAVIEQNRERISDSQLEQVRRNFLKQRLPSAIDGKLVYLDAKRHIPAEVMPGIRSQLTEYFYREHIPMMYEAYGVKNREELEARLEAFGSSLERERESTIEQSLAQQWLAQQTEVESKVTHEQMLAYYHDHIEEFSFPAKARWQQLSVRIADFSSREEAYAAIGRLGNLVLDGAPFEQVAREHSKGPTAGEGGRRDWTTRGSLVSQTLDQAIFGLPVGAMSPIIADEGSLHIVRVLEREDAGRESFVDAQVSIRKKIQQRRKQNAVEEYLAKLRSETGSRPPSTATIFRKPLSREMESAIRPTGIEGDLHLHNRTMAGFFHRVPLPCRS